MAALISIPLGLPVLRLRGVFLAIATTGFGEVVRISYVNWVLCRGRTRTRRRASPNGSNASTSPGASNGALGLAGVPPRTEGWYVYAALALVLFLCFRLRGSRVGHALEAIRQDETTARTLGINTAYYKLVAFVLSAFIAGIAGALQAHLFLIVDPGDYGFQRAVEILTYAVVGGMGFFAGPVLGAALITLLPEVLRNLSGAGITPGAVRQFVSGVILLLVILYAPGGLVTIISRLAVRVRNWQRRRPTLSEV